MIKQLLSYLFPQGQEQKQIDEYRELMRKEAQIGGQIFGPLPNGGKREFFCLDKHTWIWHEEWIDQTGQKVSKTTRYDVRPTGILKAQSNGAYHAVSEAESRNLIEAAKIYVSRCKSEIYGIA